MAKYYGRLLFSVLRESFPGSRVKEEKVLARKYSGDLIRNNKKWEQGQWENDNTNIMNTISVIMDPYVHQNLQKLRAIEFMGGFWKIKTIEVQRPRLILTIGDVYNGDWEEDPCFEW